MKKLLILTATVVLSACACFNSSDAEEAATETTTVTQTTTQTQPARQVIVAEQPVENVRVVRRIYYRDSAPVAAYREEAPVYRTRQIQENVCDEYNEYNDSPCPAKVRVTREPVEIVYRKTKYTTVYQPKTFKDVSYVSEPYSAGYDNTVTVSTSSEVEEEDDYIK